MIAACTERTTMDPELRIKDCKHMFKCRRCEHIFVDKLQPELAEWKAESLSPFGQIFCHHECPDSSGAIAVADFIALIPITKP